MASSSQANWAQLSPLLDELLDLPDRERQVRLAEVQAENSQLGEELAALLLDSQSAQVKDFLAKPLINAIDQAPESTLAGQRLGAYVLESPLGQGGTGSVWRARREDGRFTGAVAIKLLHLSLLGRAGAERFKREGDILARLTHPNIAHLLDAGVTAGGQPYLVIELVEGERIDRHCDAKRLDVNARLALFDKVLSAVAHAHTHLVIHRDIKPGNILVTADGTVKLLDFGIAKLIEDETTAAEATELTREGGRVLTPEYAAPEQLRGEAITTATDVYALGVLLYLLLSGRMPSRGPDAGFEPPPPSSQMADSALKRNLRGDLDTIVLRALKAQAAERYQGAAAFAADLQRYGQGHAVLARPDSWHYRLRKFLMRHKAQSAVVLAVALALLGGAYAQVAVLLALAVGAAVALWQAATARAQAHTAQQAQGRAEEVKQFISSIFTEAKPREGVGGVVTAIDLLRSAAERIEVELSGNPSVAAELGVLVAEGANRLDDSALARQACDAALPRCIRSFGDTHALTLQARYLLIAAANERGDYKLAASMGPQLVADLRLKLPLHVSMLVSSLREHSFQLAKHEQQAPSLAALHEAVEIAEKHLGLLHEETLTSIGLLSNTFTHFALHAESLPVARLAMERALTACGDLRPHTQLVPPERWYAAALNNCGRPADAEPIARRCVADQRLLDGENSMRVVNATRVHASALASMGRWADAVQLTEQIRADQERLLPGDHIDAATAARALAMAWWPTRRADLIVPLLAQEEAVLARLKADTPAKTMARHRNRAYLAAWAGDLLTVQTRADIVMADTTPAFANERARVTCALSLVLRHLGRHDEALSFAEQALALAQAKAPNLMPVDVAQAQVALGLAQLELGQVDTAMTHLGLAQSEFERGQVVPSVWYADARLGQARVHILRGDHSAAQSLLNQVEAWWAEANPGSIWHAEVRTWQTRVASLPA
jgi:eukaryotic-like serine/threonine-protein kinase